MLTIKNLSVKVENKKILRNISLTFKRGKIYAIMGPNGSGKSTLAHALMGNPSFSVSRDSVLRFKRKNIKKLSPDKRAHLGMFLSFQNPIALSGVSALQLLRTSLQKGRSALELKRNVQKHAHALKIAPDLLSRSLNDGFSGGEKKKMEILQAAILNPSFLILDEIDTGVDIDALKTISLFLKKFHTKDKTLVIITHYNRILKYLQPDEVIVLKNGSVVAQGGKDLAKKIEKDGYNAL